MKLQTKLPLFLAAMTINFYALPTLIIDTGSGIVLLLILMPLVCFISAIAYGLRNGWQPLLPASVFLLFLPSLYIFYNESALIYAFAYPLITLIGNITGLYAAKLAK